MIVRREEGDLCLGSLGADETLGKAHVLRRVAGAVLHKDVLFRDALRQKIVPHSRGLGADLVRPLPAGDDEAGLLPGLLQLIAVKRKREIEPPAQQRRGLAVLFQPAAEHDEPVLVRLGDIARGDEIGDDRADDHALEIQVKRGQQIDDEVPCQRPAQRDRAPIVQHADQRLARHQRKGQDDGENVDEAPPLVPDQRDVRYEERDGEER